MKEKILEYVKKYAKQESTWVGAIVALLTALGVGIPEGAEGSIGQIVTGALSLIMILLNQKKNIIVKKR